MNNEVEISDPLVRKMRLLDLDEVPSLFKILSDVNHPVIVGFLNQHGYNLAQRNKRMFDNMLTFDYLLRDGIGMKIACRLNNLDAKANLNGSDLIPGLINYLVMENKQRYQFFAMGTKSPWLESGAAELFQGNNFCAIDGFRESSEYIDFLKENRQNNKIAVVVLAMGMPKQEEIAHAIRESQKSPTVIICGGAILDFKAKRFPRAPLWVQKINMEWMYRLVKEPRRLFSRYVIGIPIFLKIAAGNARNASYPLLKRNNNYSNLIVPPAADD